MVSILLVEDEEVALKLLVAILGKRFPEVVLHPALNGRAGLALFEEHAPDIVITDINMPVMNGFQMLERIRMTNRETKVILLTAGNGNADAFPGAGKGVGVDHCIFKPINFALLFGAIEQCLGEIARRNSVPGASVELLALLDALEGDREALVELIGDFLATYPGHLLRISEAICAGDARHLQKSAHKFKGSLGIFSRAEPLALTQRLIDMGERETLDQAPQTLDLLEGEMEQLIHHLREVAGC